MGFGKTVRTAPVPPVFVTQFPDQKAFKILEQGEMTIDELADMIENAPPMSEKALLPWLKLAKFGKKRSKKHCLRTDANVVAISGVEGDYDAELLSMTKAAEMLRVAGIAAILYTSGSHTPEKPRWRVLAFLRKPIRGTSDELKLGRKRFVGIVNAVLGGVLADESFTLSLAYCYGSVEGKRKVEVVRVPGSCIDRLKNPPAPVFAGGKTTQHETPQKTRAELLSPHPEKTKAQLLFIPNTERDWHGWKEKGAGM
jgi:hypothetical protein